MHTSPTSRRDIGNTWEDIACKYLESRGYTIIERNWQIKGGEIDIIAAKDGHYHCIEVRYRKNERFGHPLDTLTAKKRFTLKRSLFLYMYAKNIDPEFIQVDFLGIMPQGDVDIVSGIFPIFLSNSPTTPRTKEAYLQGV